MYLKAVNQLNFKIMNRFLSGLILLSILLASCKKDDSKKGDSSQDQTLRKVSFNIGFSKSITGTAVNSLQTNAIDSSFISNPNIVVLYYEVFDSNGDALRLTQQLSKDPGFGSYTDNLRPGTYTIVVAAGQDGLKIKPLGASDLGNINNNALNYDGRPLYGSFGDTFYKKFTITVSDTDIIKEVSLDRIVTQVEINILDAIPANTASLIVEGFSTSSSFLVGSGTASGEKIVQMSSSIQPSSWGTKNFHMAWIYLPGPSTTLKLHFLCLSAVDNSATPGSFKILAEKYIDATVFPNRKTILTGTLFGSSASGSGFKATIDTAWDATPINKTF